MGDDDKSATLITRVLSYGDDAVARGNVATQSKVVPPAPAAPPVDLVRVVLIDRRGLVTDAMRQVVRARLERDLNALGVVAKEPDVLWAQSLRFEIRWESKVPSANQQGSYGKWDFPLYFEKAHTSDNMTAAEVLVVLQAHGIRNAGRGADQYADSESGWNDKSDEGLGIQPLQGYRKVGFLKVDQLSGRARDIQTAYVNVVKHELGHMCNITKHSQSGLMQKSASLDDEKAAFAEEDQRKLLRELVRLKAQSETNMQRAYEQNNR